MFIQKHTYTPLKNAMDILGSHSQLGSETSLYSLVTLGSSCYQPNPGTSQIHAIAV